MHALVLEGLLGPETQIQSPQRRGNLNGDHTVTQFDMRGHEGGERDKKIGKYDKATKFMPGSKMTVEIRLNYLMQVSMQEIKECMTSS